jgi:lysophospholipase L1-like esterase
MSDPYLLAVGLLIKGQMSAKTPPADPFQNSETPSQLGNSLKTQPAQKLTRSVSTAETTPMEFSRPILSPPAYSNFRSWRYEPVLPSEPTEVPLQTLENQDSIVSPELSTPRPQPPIVRPPVNPPIAYAPLLGRRPVSGSQLYQQRITALSAGQTYTRLPADSYSSVWTDATEQPSYEDWQYLLEREASALGQGQGSNRLSVLIGDSLSLWFPPENLSVGRLWLNQGISGDTTGGILERISFLSPTHPDQIYVMAGINDLRRGKSDDEIINNLYEIIHRLRTDHPHAQIILQSILPTRFAAIPNSRIQNINRQLAVIAQEAGANYLDIHRYFLDEQGNLRRELTTDGLHLNVQGYAVWRWALQETDSRIARN